ncbi:MAG: hypothetical protein IRZ16_23515 [Myxococcaceae bacterium]|nr:hypothetical protein [Myxococcaceae bacterium]
MLPKFFVLFEPDSCARFDASASALPNIIVVRATSPVRIDASPPGMPKICVLFDRASRASTAESTRSVTDALSGPDSAARSDASARALPKI